MVHRRTKDLVTRSVVFGRERASYGELLPHFLQLLGGSDYTLTQSIARDSAVGQSLNNPKPVLQLPHSNPRISPVEWLWSTANRLYLFEYKRAWQIPHLPPCL
jgi:hypothetical protein